MTRRRLPANPLLAALLTERFGPLDTLEAERFVRPADLHLSTVKAATAALAAETRAQAARRTVLAGIPAGNLRDAYAVAARPARSAAA